MAATYRPDQVPSLARIAGISASKVVEIGTWEGAFAHAILLNTPSTTEVYCVDPYAAAPDLAKTSDWYEISQTEFDSKYEAAKTRLSGFGDRVKFLRKPSAEAAADFEDESIDVVYVDGDHDYKGVLQDIMLWWPKVKPGGYLLGDDVHSTNLAEHDPVTKNVRRDWNSTSWAVFGTYPALMDARAHFGPSNFRITFHGTQFSVHKKLPEDDDA